MAGFANSGYFAFDVLERFAPIAVEVRVLECPALIEDK